MNEDTTTIVCGGKGSGKCEEMRKQLNLSPEAFMKLTEESDRLLEEAKRRHDERERLDYILWATGAYDYD